MSVVSNGRWEFLYCHPHNGEYWHKCAICGEQDWIARYGTLSQLRCKCNKD